MAGLGSSSRSAIPGLDRQRRAQVTRDSSQCVERGHPDGLAGIAEACDRGRDRGRGAGEAAERIESLRRARRDQHRRRRRGPARVPLSRQSFDRGVRRPFVGRPGRCLRASISASHTSGSSVIDGKPRPALEHLLAEAGAKRPDQARRVAPADADDDRDAQDGSQPAEPEDGSRDRTLPRRAAGARTGSSRPDPGRRR